MFFNFLTDFLILLLLAILSVSSPLTHEPESLIYQLNNGDVYFVNIPERPNLFDEKNNFDEKSINSSDNRQTSPLLSPTEFLSRPISHPKSPKHLLSYTSRSIVNKINAIINGQLLQNEKKNKFFKI